MATSLYWLLCLAEHYCLHVLCLMHFHCNKVAFLLCDKMFSFPFMSSCRMGQKGPVMWQGLLSFQCCLASWPGTDLKRARQRQQQRIGMSKTSFQWGLVWKMVTKRGSMEKEWGNGVKDKERLTGRQRRWRKKEVGVDGEGNSAFELFKVSSFHLCIEPLQ